MSRYTSGRQRRHFRGSRSFLTRSERVAHRPRLDKTHEGVINRRVTVGVVLTHHITDDAGALRESLIRPVSAVKHGVEHAAVDGFEAITHVGQCASDDHAHRIVQIGPLHFEL